MTRSFLIAAFALWPAFAGAQTPSGLPEGYAGRQFTDASGCQFQRSDNGTWAPRLGRDGKPLCGYSPTQQASAPATPALPAQVTMPPAASAVALPPVDADPYAALAQDGSLRAPGMGTDPAAELAQDGSVHAPGAEAPVAAQAETPRRVQRRSTRKVTPRRSSRKTTPRRAAPSSEGHRYVQVGAFSVSDHARQTEQKLLAMGLPVSRGRSQVNGEWLVVVLAGPFEDHDALRAARRNLRQNGYPHAFSR